MPVTKLSEKRSHAVKVTLTPTSWDKLTFVAEQLGVAPSQVATMAVSEYAAMKSIALKSSDVGTKQIIDVMVPALTEMLSNIPANEG